MIPGSALRRLEAITGLVATKEADKCYKLTLSEGVAYVSFVKDEKEACESLRKDNWRRVVVLASEAAQWLCVRCGQRRPLQGHHRLYRSRWRRQDGPLDVVSNCDVLCSECHDKEHHGVKIQGGKGGI